MTETIQLPRNLRTEIFSERLLEKIGKKSQESEINDLQYVPAELAPPQGLLSYQVKDKSFTNVSFSYTVIRRMVFTNCVFEHSDFVESHFVDCEFHECQFTACNLWKARFRQTYVDPEIFKDLYSPNKDANKGVGLFQSLLANAADTHQPEFETTARFYFYKWQRHQLKYEWKKLLKTSKRPHTKTLVQCTKRGMEIAWNFTKEWTIGYGLRLLNFAITSAVLYLIATAINYCCWGVFLLRMKRPSGFPVVDSLYFTATTLLTVGFGDIVPVSEVGRSIIAIEAILGVLWLGLLTGILVRKVIK